MDSDYSAADKAHRGFLDECEKEDRRAFVLKVYGILTTQLVVTFGSVAVVKTTWMNDSLQDPSNGVAQGIYIAALVVALLIQCCVGCFHRLARKSPTNFILLAIFTLCYTYVISFVSTLYDEGTVLAASLFTAVITITLSLYAARTESDFTELCGPFMCFGLLLMLLVQLVMSIISIWIFTFSSVWVPFAAGACVIFYGLFLIIDTQLIVGGRRYELTIDDYVIGAMILYVDIIMIFLELLRLFGGK